MTLSQTYSIKRKFRASIAQHVKTWGAIELITIRKFWKEAHK